MKTLTELKKIIDERKIAIGAQQLNLKASFKILKHSDITTLIEAEKKLNKIESTFDDLTKEEKRIQIEIEKILEDNE